MINDLRLRAMTEYQKGMLFFFGTGTGMVVLGFRILFEENYVNWKYGSQPKFMGVLLVIFGGYLLFMSIQRWLRSKN